MDERTAPKWDERVRQLTRLREDALGVLGEILHDPHLARLARRFAEIQSPIDRLRTLGRRVERRPVQPFYNLGICGASDPCKTGSPGDACGQVRDAIEGRYGHLETLLGEHGDIAGSLRLMDAPEPETAARHRDGALRVPAQRTPAEILRGMLEDDALDALVLFVRTADEAELDKIRSELDAVQPEDLGLDNRLFIALTGFHTAADGAAIAQAGEPVEKRLRTDVLSTLKTSRAVVPAGVSFIRSPESSTDGPEPDSSPHRERRENRLAQVEPAVGTWREELAELYPGAADDFDANLRALADPGDGGVGHLLRTVARHLKRHGIRQKLAKHLVRGGLCESLDKGLDLLDRVFDDRGELRRDLRQGPAERLRDILTAAGLGARELAAAIPEVQAECTFSAFLTGESDSLRKRLVALLDNRLDPGIRTDIDSLVTRTLEAYLKATGPAEPPTCSTPHESRHWTILARRCAAYEIVHQLAGGAPVSVGSADPAEDARPMHPERVLELRRELTGLREHAYRLVEGMKREG